MLILSLFPGVGLLDMAFEEAGACVVRGPDLLWGGDIHHFTPPPGRFDGVIGGPPCQRHSAYATLNEAQGKQIAPDLVPEFMRVVGEARPGWFLMENATAVPNVTLDGYAVTRLEFDNRWLGEPQARRRSFQFGTPNGARLAVEFAALDHMDHEDACLASEGGTGRMKRTSVAGKDVTTYKPRRDWGTFCKLQGLPGDFLADSPFTVAGKYLAVGNGVPLPMGRAIAKAVMNAVRA